MQPLQWLPQQNEPSVVRSPQQNEHSTRNLVPKMCLWPIVCIQVLVIGGVTSITKKSCPTGQLYPIIRHAIAQISAKTVTQHAQYGEESGSRKKQIVPKLLLRLVHIMPQDQLAKYYVSCLCLESGSSSDMLPAIRWYNHCHCQCWYNILTWHAYNHLKCADRWLHVTIYVCNDAICREQFKVWC